MAVVFFRRGHGQDVDAETQEIFDRRAGHVVLGVIPQHGDHRAVRTGRAFPVCAVKAIFFRIKMKSFSFKTLLLCIKFLLTLYRLQKGMKKSLDDKINQ